MMGIFANSNSAKIILLVILAAICVKTSYCEDQLEDVDEDRLRELGKRLVRRNFLRFGKRSSQHGPGEEANVVIMGKHPHKPNTRSFLRFGRSGQDVPERRADNFLRFGKSFSLMDNPRPKGSYVPVGFQDSDQNGREYRSKALKMLENLISQYSPDSHDKSDNLAGISQEESNEDDVNYDYIKKSNDFLRFGKR